MVGLPSCPLFGDGGYLNRGVPLMMLAALEGSAIPLVRDRFMHRGGALLLSVAATAHHAGPSVLLIFIFYLRAVTCTGVTLHLLIMRYVGT